MAVRDLVDTPEMYLRTIYELEEEGITPLRARIAERLEQSGPTVSQTVARMERDGLLRVASDRSLQLTDEGRARAIAVMRKHRLTERLLTDVIGLEWDKVHDEACRWEHVMSVEVERRLVHVLDEHTISPFGNPIPGLDELGTTSTPSPVNGAVRLSELPTGGPATVQVTQINEVLQEQADRMKELAAAGVAPGATIEAERLPEGGRLTSNGVTIELPEAYCHAIHVLVSERQ